MKCMFCNKTATVHLTDIVNLQKREAHLCEECARERNLLPASPAPNIDLKALMALLAPSVALAAGASAGTVAPTETRCPECGLTYATFKAEGRLGCPHDYDAFRPVLEPLLERVHRDVQHAGKQPAATRKAAQLDELRSQLKTAVANEDYERAARLRDRIRDLAAEGTPG